MNKILLLAGMCLLIISVIGFVIYERPEIKITPVYISENISEYSDLYKIQCGDKKFYTSYPDRLNLEDVCKW